MEEEEKKNHISRIKLRNIANANYYKPVTERNNVFCRVKRNSAVLSRIENMQEKFNHLFQGIESSNIQSRVELMSKKYSNKQIRGSRRYSSANQSIGSASSLNKRNLNSPRTQIHLPLPQIRKSKQLSLSSSTKSKGFDDSQNSSKNSIQGTKIGVLSTKQILKKYEIKKLSEELNKKKFLDDYIKNMKTGEFEIDEEGEDGVGDHLTQPKHLIDTDRQSVKLPRSQSVNNNMSMTESQQKLVKLLENRLTDRDYIDFNVKLFEKRDINKKKFFQRYHNILKQQRQQIVNS